MTTRFQFRLVVRGQAEKGEDISRASRRHWRLADRLGFDSITKTAHYSAYETVSMLGVFTPPAGTDGWPSTRKRRDLVRKSHSSQKS